MSQVIRIPNIKNYTQEIVNGELILTPKQQKHRHITENEFDNTNFSGSFIVECEVKKEEEIISTNKKYICVLIDIWKTMPTQKILQTTTFRFREAHANCVKGYNWCDEIRMSFENKDVKETLKELLHMVKVNNYSINLTVKLESGEIIHLN